MSTTSTEHLLNVLKLRSPIAYKLQDGYVWALVSSKPYWKRLYWTWGETNLSPFNQMFGENATTFYSQLGMLGHNGLDYYAPDNTSLFACYDAVVGWVNDPTDTTAYQEGYGGLVELLINVKGRILRSVYAHLSKVLVKTGQHVGAGQLIALSDNTGKYTTGSHLHWGICEMNTAGVRLNQDNGYLGYLDQKPLLLDTTIKEIDDVEKLYWYGASMGVEPFGYFTGLLGGWRKSQAIKELGLGPVTDGQLYDFAVKHITF